MKQFVRFIQKYISEEAVAQLGEELRERQVDNMSYAIERIIKKEIAAGREAGRQESFAEVILKMLQNDVETAVISNYLGISVNRVEQLEKLYLEEKEQNGEVVIKEVVEKYLESHAGQAFSADQI